MVNSFLLIRGDLSFYIDLMGSDTSLLVNNLSEIERYNAELEYLLYLKDLEKANLLKVKLKNSMESENVDNFILNINLMYLSFLNDKEKGLLLAKRYFDKNKTIEAKNFYLYLLSVYEDTKTSSNNKVELTKKQSIDKINIDLYTWFLVSDGPFRPSVATK